MAKYDVTYSCGHSATVSLVGKQKERDRKLEWYREAGLCPECYAAKKDQERQEQTAAAEKNAEMMGLRPLNGTEKQIAWAEVIRQKRIQSVFIASQRVSEKLPHLWSKFEDCLCWLRDQVDAKWWIDNRDLSPSDLLVECPAFGELVEDLPPEVAKVYRGRLEQVREREAERDKTQRKNDLREQTRERVRALFGEDCPVKVGKWGDKRVYLGGYETKLAEYFVDGNRYNRPGTLHRNDSAVQKITAANGCTEEEADAKLRELCEWLGATWNQFAVN